MKAAVTKAAAIVALLAAAAAAPAFAQETAAPTESTTAPAEGTAEQVEKPGTKSATTTLNTSTTTPMTTSTASLPAVVKAAAPRKLFAEFYTETFLPMADFEQGKGEARLDSFGGLKYDLGNTNSVAVRQNFVYLSPSGSGTGQFKTGDLALQFTRGKLLEFKDGTTVTFQARAYVPYGDESRAADNHGQQRVYLITSKSVGKLDLAHVLLGRIQQPGHDYDVKIDDKGKVKYTKFREGMIVNEVDAFYNFTSKFALGMIVGYENHFFTPTPGTNRQEDDVYFQPTIQVAPVKGLTLQALIYNEIQVRNPDSSHFRAFRQKDTSVSFNVAAQL